MRFLLHAITAAVHEAPVSGAGGVQVQTVDPHGWMEAGVSEGQSGPFEFQGGYPTADSVSKLEETLLLSRAVDVYLAQMPAVSWYRVWKGTSEAGTGAPNQLVIWETLHGCADAAAHGQHGNGVRHRWSRPEARWSHRR